MEDKKYTELVDKDFPKTIINEQALETTKKESVRFRGGVRTSLAKFQTTEAYEQYRETVLNTKLP